jgi:hypothetical protein
MENNTNNLANAKKSKALSILIGVLVLALILVLVLSKNETKDTENVPVENNTSLESDEEGSVSSTPSIPEPVGVWTKGGIKEDITFDVPPNYYVSRPVIGGCSDVVSITTQTPSAPTVPVALIYKEGCVTDTEVINRYTYREVKNGYVFQTNTTNDTVKSLFDRIVASAK